MKFLVFFPTPEARDGCMAALQKDKIDVLLTGELAPANLSRPPGNPLPALIVNGNSMVGLTCMQHGASSCGEL